MAKLLSVLGLASLLVAAPHTAAAQGAGCRSVEANRAYEAGFTAQKAGRTQEALQSYRRCLEVESGCEGCQYEIGWSFWVLELQGTIFGGVLASHQKSNSCWGGGRAGCNSGSRTQEGRMFVVVRSD